MFDILTLDTNLSWRIFGVFACLLSHMSVQTSSGRFMRANTHTHKSLLCPSHETQSRGHTHKSMRSHDGPECVQNGDNRSPRAMSLRSSWQDTRRQMLRAKGTLSSPVWNTCVQCDNDKSTVCTHSRRGNGSWSCLLAGDPVCLSSLSCGWCSSQATCLGQSPESRVLHKIHFLSGAT